LWPHSYNSQDKSLVAWEGERWAGPAVVPSLVLELALSQLRSLLAEVSPASSDWEEVVAPEVEHLHADVEGRP